MKILRDAFLRSLAATVVFGILTSPLVNFFLIRIGNYFNWKRLLFNFLTFFVTVFLGMIAYNLLAARCHKKS